MPACHSVCQSQSWLGAKWGWGLFLVFPGGYASSYYHQQEQQRATPWWCRHFPLMVATLVKRHSQGKHSPFREGNSDSDRTLKLTDLR